MYRDKNWKSDRQYILFYVNFVSIKKSLKRKKGTGKKNEYLLY